MRFFKVVRGSMARYRPSLKLVGDILRTHVAAPPLQPQCVLGVAGQQAGVFQKLWVSAESVAGQAKLFSRGEAGLVTREMIEGVGATGREIGAPRRLAVSTPDLALMRFYPGSFRYVQTLQ